MEQLFEALSSKIYEKYKTNISEHYQEFEDLSGYVATQFSRKDPAPSYSDYQKEVLKQGWQHFQKKILEKGHNTNIMNFVDSYDQFRGGQTGALKGMYQHTGYGQERQEMQSLVIDSLYSTPSCPGTNGSTTTFSINLVEPLIIDKLSNIYLDSISTLGINSNTSAKDMCILLNIDQFNINTKGTGITTAGSTTNNLNDKILIPNSASAASGTITHKGNKFNYVAQINPQKITQISGSITGADQDVIFGGSGRFIMEFLIIASEKISWK